MSRYVVQKVLQQPPIWQFMYSIGSKNKDRKKRSIKARGYCFLLSFWIKSIKKPTAKRASIKNKRIAMPRPISVGCALRLFASDAI